MNGPIDTKVLIDTCFLIALVNEQDPFHKNAEEYFRHFVESGTELLLSAICMSELYERQELEIIENFRVISFSIDEVAAQRKFFARTDTSSSPDSTRIQVKDDIKIISSGLAHGAAAVLSANDDFNKMAERVGLRVIDYRVPLATYLGKLPL